ncbi:arsenic resistance N-acetyltransferase ArsN2 [Marinomonas sp. PE14-40]|uniref:arsenic resistance N-acetyltransferase ArsN2 n=1 Tax=Marinomonas sp. PE14-40 TaxID=3060621 RepID=UPI003F668F5D
MAFSKAEIKDLNEIERLLKESDLPYEDCQKHLSNFIVCRENSKIIAMGGTEVYGRVALIRSIVVQQEYRGKDLAKAIFLHLQASAQQQGVSSLYLLTNNAEDYFKVLGFSPVIRSEVPLAIQNTDQFSSLCPGTATVMALNLS